MIGRTTTWPSTTQGLSLVACIPRTAVCAVMDSCRGQLGARRPTGVRKNEPGKLTCGVLRIGVPNSEPKTPPFELFRGGGIESCKPVVQGEDPSPPR